MTRRILPGLLRVIEHVKKAWWLTGSFIGSNSCESCGESGVSHQKCVLKSLDVVGMTRKCHFNFFFALLLPLNFACALLHIKIHVLSDFTVVSW